jgi:hypothetical protein
MERGQASDPGEHPGTKLVARLGGRGGALEANEDRGLLGGQLPHGPSTHRNHPSRRRALSRLVATTTACTRSARPRSVHLRHGPTQPQIAATRRCPRRVQSQ